MLDALTKLRSQTTRGLKDTCALTSGRTRVALLVTVQIACWPAAGAAQRPLVGVVVDRETSAPLAGVYVALEARASERAVGAALTDSAGRFVLSARVGSTYRLRAERVGLGTEVTDWFLVEEDGTPHRIAMAERAVELEGLSVTGRVRTCQLERGEALVVQRWWDEVRKALQVTAFGDASDVGGLRFQRFEREWSSNMRALRHERELPPDSTPARPFLSQGAESLSELGFVQGREGNRLFLAPDASVLFSEAFLSDHCLRIAEDGEELMEGRGRAPGELHLAVEPTRDRPSDIRGVLTVDTVSGELRSFDFSYANLPPDIPRSRAGGHLAFAYLPSGAWIVSDWWVRLPRVEYRWGEGERRGAVPLLTGYVDQGGRALDPEGRPVEPRRDGGRATLRGLVYDSLSGQPLTGARVSVVGSRYSARTGPDGRFTLAGVPAGRRALTVYHPELTRLGLPSPVFAVDLAAGTEEGMTLATPGFPSTARLICADTGGTPAAILTGQVVTPVRGEGSPSAEIRAQWVQAGRSMRSEGRAGFDGRYVLCALPAGAPVSLAVRTDATVWREAGTVELVANRIAALELRPGAEARAVLRGTVRTVEEGDALPGADVRVLAVTGDTVAHARADASGAFWMSVASGVGYRAVADAQGYLREASAAFTLDGAESLDVTFELVRDVAALAMKIEGLVVEVEARSREAARRLLRQYGQNETTMGRRWIGVGTLDSIPATGESDPGVAIARQGMAGVWVDQAAKRGRDPYLCVQQKQRRCSIIILNGMKIDLGTALLIDFRELEGIAVLRPEDATTFYGTVGGGGAVVLWTRGSGR